MESKSFDFIEKVVTGLAVVAVSIIIIAILGVAGQYVSKSYPTIDFKGLQYFVFPAILLAIVLVCYIAGKIWLAIFPSNYDGLEPSENLIEGDDEEDEYWDFNQRR